MVKFYALLLAFITLATPILRAENIVTELTKVADMPSFFSTTDPLEAPKNPSSPRGGILQMGDEIWFTTYEGGVNKVGSIVSYNLTSNSYALEYSFGLSDPNNPATARMDGVNPWKTTLTLGSDGRVYYAAYTGGATAATAGNGGAIGSFNPSTVGSVGVNVHWSGDTTGTNLRNLAYASPIYVERAGGAKDIYTLTNGGGTGGWGGVEKISLDAAGSTVSTMVITNFTGPNGRQVQGGAVQVEGKVYFASGSTASGANATLSVLDTTTDVVTVLSTSFRPNTTVNNNGVWSTPIYDEDANALYGVGLKGGIVKWDITTGVQSVLANSFDGGVGNNFADPILFGESIYYIKQTGSGQIWRYDMGSESISMLYDLSAFGVTAGANQSGTFDIVVEDGREYLYFLTSGGGTNNTGALMRLEVTVVPEPGSVALVLGGLAAIVSRRGRRA
jgi:hypothetical protein